MHSPEYKDCDAKWCERLCIGKHAEKNDDVKQCKIDCMKHSKYSTVEKIVRAKSKPCLVARSKQFKADRAKPCDRCTIPLNYDVSKARYLSDKKCGWAFHKSSVDHIYCRGNYSFPAKGPKSGQECVFAPSGYKLKTAKRNAQKMGGEISTGEKYISASESTPHLCFITLSGHIFALRCDAAGTNFHLRSGRYAP